jgi:hypothetical protein
MSGVHRLRNAFRAPARSPGMDAAGEPDYDELGDYFKALGYGARLELLHELLLPRALNEITLAARRTGPGQQAGRRISRQATQEHLEKLMEIGVVVAREPDAPTGKRQFVVNGPRLYQLMEEFRRVGTLMPGVPVGRDATVGLASRQAARPEPGPKLVLVHGLHEGKPFPLRRTDLDAGRGWVLGRKPGLHVSLDYDPFVSLENSEVVPEANRYLLLDLPSSRNGTWLNWRRLDKAERAPLEPGDVVGVGRSLLVFRPA